MGRESPQRRIFVVSDKLEKSSQCVQNALNALNRFTCGYNECKTSVGP